MIDNDEARNNEPDTAGTTKPDTRFKPGNPGKPKGARNRATQMLEALFEGEAEEIGRAALEAAKGGDVQAMKLILDRLAPARKTRHIAIELPRIETAADLLSAQGVVVEAMAGGQITPDEATEIGKVLEYIGAAIERRDLEARIAALEAREDV